MKMWNILILILLLIFVYSIADAKDIQLFNTEILGQSTSSAIKLLLDKKSSEIEPVTVMVDVKCGKYYAASIIYPKNVAFNDARESINKIYMSYETLSLFEESKMAAWRVKDEQFAISLTPTALGDPEENRIRVMYLKFQPTKEVFKGILKSMRANADSIASDECPADQKTGTTPPVSTP